MNPPSGCPQPRRPQIWGDFIQPQPRVHPLGILGDLGGSGDAPSTDAADAEEMICCGFTELLSSLWIAFNLPVAKKEGI